jgi:hypothetical protein
MLTVVAVPNISLRTSEIACSVLLSPCVRQWGHGLKLVFWAIDEKKWFLMKLTLKAMATMMIWLTIENPWFWHFCYCLKLFECF